jgi:WD40 repeat protein
MRGLDMRLRMRYAEGAGVFPVRGPRSGSSGKARCREELTDTLVDRLERSRFLSVVGASGCGKSSLVRAGWLDALESGFMASAGAGWQVAEMRPGGRPMLALAEALLTMSECPRYEPDSAFLQATLRVLQGHSAGALKIAVHAAPGTDQGVQVFSASNDGTIRRWDIAPLPSQRLVDLPGEANPAAIAPDGTYVAVGFASGALRLYALPDMRLVREEEKAHERSITRLSFNTDGTLLASASFDDTAKLWAVAPDGTLTAGQIFSGHTDAVHGLAFSPEGARLATASYDGRIGLFTVGTEEKQFIDAHEGRVASVAFGSSGSRLLSA